MTGWMAAAVVTLMIRMCFSVYTMLSESCPRMVIVGYGRCFADRQNLMVCLRSMPNVFTGSCARMRCCLSENLLYRHRNGHIQAEWLWKKVISDGALTGSSSAVITEKNCESRSRWTAVTVRHCTGRSLRAASTVKQYRTSCWERWNAASATSFRRLQ